MSPARRKLRQGGRLRLGMGGRLHVGMGGRLRRNPQWVSNSGPPKTIEDLIERRRTEPHVIVLDQMERLSPGTHPDVFGLIKRIASAPLPSMLTLVIVLQQERLLDWFKFQPELQPERIRHLPLYPFSRWEAEDVLVTLLDEIHSTIDRSDLRTIVADIANGEEVLPAEVGVVFLMLSEILQSGHLSGEQLRTMGGGTGLRTAYVKRVLSLLPKSLQSEVLRALVALIDMRTLQPVAEGLSRDELLLAVKPVSEPDFLNALDTLAIPFARLLLKEEAEGVPRYRLLHKGLVRAVLHVADVRYVPAAEVLDTAYEIHRASPDYLLPRKGLRTVLQALKEGSLVVVDPERIEYIQRSRRHLWRRRFLQVLLVPAVVLVVGAVHLSSERTRERQLLESWGLPADVRGEPLRSVSLGGAVNRLDWLPGSLEHLRLNRSRIRNLQDLPRGLKTLELSGTALESLGVLPPELVRLSAEFNRLKSLRGVPESLRSLTLAEEGIDLEELSRFQNLKFLRITGAGELELDHLPDSLEALSLTRARIDSWAGISGRLTSLRLEGASVRTFEGLPASLEALSLVKGDVPLRSEELPDSLLRLELDHQPYAGRLLLPPGLVSLVIKKNQEGACLPDGTRFPVTLAHLSLYGCEYNLSQLPKTLSSLALDARSVGALDRLPRALRSVRLDMYQGQDLLGLPPSLESVAVTFSRSLRSLRGLPASVHELDLSGSAVADLSLLPEKLETMTFRWSGMRNLPALPDTLRELDLLGSERLEELPKLPSGLRRLNIAGTKIRDSRYLPEGIAVLYLSPDQLRRLSRNMKLQELHIVEDPIAAWRRGEPPR